MNKIEYTHEEKIFRDLARLPVNYDYVEHGKYFYKVTKDGETFKIGVRKIVEKRTRNRPRGKLSSLEDLISPSS